MNTFLIIAVCVLFCLLLLGISIYNIQKANNIKHQANQIKIEKTYSQQKENQLKERLELLKNQIKDLDQTENNKRKIISQINEQIQKKRKEVNKDYEIESQIIRSRLDEFKSVSSQAAKNYIKTLEQDYKHAEAAHKQQITSLEQEFSTVAAELDKIKETRKAAYQAVLKEKEVKQNKENYKLTPTQDELEDIYTLENIKKGLHKPRILSMLIWQTFWQPLAKKQFPVILQDKTKVGIYKITNTQTDQSYIGQSLDIYKRWCSHCKAGLGIDAPVGNKLYKAMRIFGLQNFTFELLCECSKQQLDEKEKYFIELYQSDIFGYNGTGGNKK